ncbi:hypothetical protein M8J75_006775 [Diaphorina citri]|nr:hypothetical protein M8J75_006775 [Diaphorina citri]
MSSDEECESINSNESLESKGRSSNKKCIRGEGNQKDTDNKWAKFIRLNKVEALDDGGAKNDESLPPTPLDILFPDDLEKLRNELQVLKEEKSLLEKKLEDSIAKCELLNIELETTNKFRNPITGAQLATNKIVELSKKIRELTADLGASKLQCRQLENIIKQFSAIHEPNGVKAVSSGDGRNVEQGCCGDTSDEQKKLKKQMEALQLKLFRTRSDCERLKTELDFAHKVIKKETGKEAEVVLKDFKEDNQSWIGRAEQIAALRDKVAELTEKIDTRKSCFMMNRNKVDVLKAREKEMKTEHQKEIQSLRTQIEEFKKSNVGAKARYHVLECELKDERNKIKLLTEKSTTDDEMIEIFKKKVKTNAADKIKDKETVKALENQMSSLQDELAQTKTKCEQLISAIGERDARIREQEHKLKAMGMLDDGLVNVCNNRQDNSVDKDTAQDNVHEDSDE